MYKQSNYIGDTVVASTVAHEQAGKPVDIHSKYPSLDTYCARSSPPRVEHPVTPPFHILPAPCALESGPLPKKVMIHIDERPCASLFANLTQKDFSLLT